MRKERICEKAKYRGDSLDNISTLVISLLSSSFYMGVYVSNLDPSIFSRKIKGYLFECQGILPFFIPRITLHKGSPSSAN